MTDVRMLVSEADLQEQLQFFKDPASGAINVRTVSSSSQYFINRMSCRRSSSAHEQQQLAGAADEGRLFCSRKLHSAADGSDSYLVQPVYPTACSDRQFFHKYSVDSVVQQCSSSSVMFAVVLADGCSTCATFASLLLFLVLLAGWQQLPAHS
jgi:hypothetical protein